MLTKKDLQQIQVLIRSETREVVHDELKPVKKDIKILQKDMRYVKKTINVMVNHFDREDVSLIKRVRKIEDHIGFAQA